MRILYLTDVDIYDTCNLLDKMNSQICEWSKLGHSVYVLTLNGARSKGNVKLTSSVIGYKNPVSKHLPNIPVKSIYRLLNKVFSVVEIKKLINDFNPDIIYLREFIAFPGIDKILKSHKVILESNTLLKQELQTKNFAARKFYDFFQNLIYDNIDGFIGVTNEISNQFLKYNKPIVAISNGIKLDDLSRTFTSRNSIANVIFVGTPGLPWHGFDKYERLAELLPNINFHLVGPNYHRENIPNLICHGYLNSKDLDKLYSKMDIGVGTLALHRKSMKEACPLKVREYAYYGLPFVIAYIDADFIGEEFILQLPNTELCIEENIREIEDFIITWKGTKVDIERLKPLISLEIKEKERIDFFYKVLST